MDYRNKFWGFYYNFLESALDGLQERQQAIAQNIANANNPNYHPVHVEFEKELYGAYQGIVDDVTGRENTQYNLKMDPIKFDFDPEFHATGSQEKFHTVITRDPKAHVDLNKEMAELAKTQVMYNMLAVEDTPSQSKFVVETFK